MAIVLICTCAFPFCPTNVPPKMVAVLEAKVNCIKKWIETQQMVLYCTYIMLLPYIFLMNKIVLSQQTHRSCDLFRLQPRAPRERLHPPINTCPQIIRKIESILELAGTSQHAEGMMCMHMHYALLLASYLYYSLPISLLLYQLCCLVG